MKVTIIGTGNMGQAFAKRLLAAGHAVSVVAKIVDKGATLSALLPGAVSIPATDAAAGADAVIVATAFADSVSALKSLGDLTGKVIVDISNPLSADYMSLTVGHSTSAAEEIAAAVPGSLVVKAFNTVFAQVLDAGADFGGGNKVSTFVASDSEPAKQTVMAQAQSMGFEVIDAGGLKTRATSSRSGVSTFTSVTAQGLVLRSPRPGCTKPDHFLNPNEKGIFIMTIRQTALVAALALSMTSFAAFAQSPAEHPDTPPPPHEKQAPAVEKKLKTFDTLDFDVFSNQKWDRLKESHSADIVVTWPDGHETKGIDKHIDDLKALFVFAPDITIKTHPIRFGSGTWTSVTGVMTGTFTKPMPLPDGTSIPPTGKRFAIGMATIGHWSGSTMDHEWLFWDNKDFMSQIGLGK